MGLNNVDSSNGYLEATASDGYAVSGPIVQDTGIDISESIVPDVGLVNELVSETDIVFVKKIDNSFNKLTVGAVTEIAALETKSAIHTDYTTDGHIILTSDTIINNSYPFWKAMNGTNIATSEESAGLGTYTANQWMEYTFPASEIVTRVRINGRVDQLAGDKIEQLKVYVWDGASFVLLHTETFTLDWALLEIRNVDFINTTSSTKYRFEFVGDAGSYAIALSWFELLGAIAPKYQFDTTSVTLGEVPSAIFKADTFDGNFSGIKNISADFELVNISTATVADTLTTDETIVDGDNLVIVKNDDTIHEVVASGVTGVGPYSMDTTAITAGEIPSNVFTVDSKVSFDDGTGFIYPSELGNDYLAITSAVLAPDLTPGLVSHYLLSNNADDSFGSYDGTPSGGVDFQGDVASFDGVDDEVNIGTLSISPTFTISAWIYLNNVTERYSIVSDDNSVNLPRIFQLSINKTTGTLNYLHFDASQNVTINISGTTNLSGGLHHVVATFNQVSGVSVIYVDGILESTDTNSTIRALSNNPMIGAIGLVQNFSVYFDGDISNVRIYSDAKDQTFIDDLYAEGYYPESLPKPITDGLIAHYLLNNNADDSHGVYDASAVTDVNFQGDKAQFSLDTSLILSPVSLDSALGTTVSCFIVLDSYVPRYQTIFIGNSSLQLSIFPSDNATYPNKVYLGKAGGGFTSIISSFPLELDVTYHLVAMYDKNTVSFYVDKVLIGTVSYTGTLPNTPTYLGHYENEGTINDGNTLSGRISNFRIYNEAKDQTFIDALYAEGYYPKPLPLPTTDGLIAHYPLTGTAEDTTGNYDGVENGNTYVNDAEFGSMLRSSSSNSVPSLVYNTSLLRTSTDATTISFSIRIQSNNLSSTNFLIFAGSSNVTRFYIGASLDFMKLGIGYGEKQNVTTNTGIPFSWGELLHLTVVFNNGTARLYKNAIQGFTDTYTPTLDTQRVASIGAFWSDNSHYDTIRSPLAYLSNYRVYNRELTAEEITDIYNYEKNFRPIDIDDGLVAYYPLTKNSLDNCYNEYDGVDTSMTYDGLSAVFGGDPDYIELPDNFTEAQGAICFWLKNGSGQILGLNDSSSSNDLVYIAAGNGLTVRFKATGIATNNTIEDIGDIIDTTIYNHYMVQSDGTKYQVFINGVERQVNMSAGTNNGNWFNSLNASLINSNTLGKTRFNLEDYWGSGAMSHFRRYNKALTAEQVAVIYNTEKGELIPDVMSLTNTRQYDDIVVDGRSIETKVELKSIADKCTEVSADLWKNP